jgi:hypothetical protein
MGVLRELWYRLSFGRSPVVVLDASDAGGVEARADYCDAAVELLRGLSRSADDFRSATVMFMGGTQAVPLADFLRHWSRMWAANAGRLSIVAPVYQSLSESDAPIIIVGHAPLFDLEDWEDSAQFHRTTFVNIGSAPMTGQRATEHPPDAALIGRLLRPTLRRIVIGREGLIPIGWTNAHYGVDDQLHVIAERPADGDVTVGFLGPQGVRPEAGIEQPDGGWSALELREAAAVPRATAWSTLPAAESEVVRQCIETGHYRCPYCHGVHSASELDCMRKGEIIPRSVLGSLSRGDGGGFILVRRQRDSVEYQRMPGAALQIARDCVALARARGAATVYRYQESSNRWAPLDRPFQQFLPIDELSAHAILV